MANVSGKKVFPAYNKKEKYDGSAHCREKEMSENVFQVLGGCTEKLSE